MSAQPREKLIESAISQGVNIVFLTQGYDLIAKMTRVSQVAKHSLFAV